MGLLDDILNLNPQQDQDLPPVPLRPDYQPSPPPQINPVVVSALAKKYPAAKLQGPAPASVPDVAPQGAPPAAPPAPSVYDQFMAKYSDDQRKKAMADAQDQKSGLGWSQFAAGIGDALAGRDPSNTAKNFDSIRQGIDDRTVGAFDKQKASALQDISTKNSMAMNDPNSPQSQAVQGIFRKNFGAKYPEEMIKQITAANADLLYKPEELMAKINEQHDNNAMKREVMHQGIEDRKNKQTDSLTQKITAQLESARGNPAAAQAEKDLYAAKKVDSMVNLYSNPDKLNPQQVQLLASEVGKIASGGVPTTHELQGLNPATIPSGLASLSQTVLNKPSAANAGAFVKAMQDYTNSLKKDAQKVISEKYGRIIESNRKQLGEENYNSLKSNYLDRFKNSGGKITVTNGKETLQIDPSDLVHAQADGYREQ